MPIADAFVIMPFGEQSVVLEGKKITYETSHFDDLYDLIKEAVEEYDPTIHVERMEKKHGNLVSAIIKRIYSADMVIAVLSGRNPNVFYELGVRHALKRGTIMLVSDRNEYPFDLKGYYSEQYSIDTGKDRKQLKAFIIERFKEYAAAMLDDSPVLDILETREREQWQSINNWEARRAAVVLRGLLASITMLSKWGELWLQEVDEWLNDEEDEFAPKHPGQISVGPLQNFSESFPLIGLPSNAYIDASNLVRGYLELETNLTKLLLDRSGKMGVAGLSIDERNEFARFVGSKFLDFLRHLVLFADDVCTAMDYVITERKAYSIPWAESMDAAEQLMDVTAFSDIQTRVAKRMEVLSEAYPEFELRFSGAPPVS